MQVSTLTVKSIRARAVVLKLKRPVVARIATITDWPLILIDLTTEEGIVGRSRRSRPRSEPRLWIHGATIGREVSR
jgi:hypothetical protein